MSAYLVEVSALTAAGMSLVFFVSGHPVLGTAAAVWSGALWAFRHWRIA
jgi:hypothetical protein